MAAPRHGARIERQLGLLLLRRNRMHLYSMVAEGIEGVDVTTYPVLSGLARTGPTTSTALGADIGLNRTAVTRYLTRLEKVGYVYRTPDHSDGRAVRVDLTSDGRAVSAIMQERLRDFFADIVSTWPADEATTFVASLERFTTSLTTGRL